MTIAAYRVVKAGSFLLSQFSELKMKSGKSKLSFADSNYNRCSCMHALPNPELVVHSSQLKMNQKACVIAVVASISVVVIVTAVIGTLTVTSITLTTI